MKQELLNCIVTLNSITCLLQIQKENLLVLVFAPPHTVILYVEAVEDLHMKLLVGMGMKSNKRTQFLID